MGKKKSAGAIKVESVEPEINVGRRYFVPGAGREVEAETLANVNEKLNETTEVGDGN